MKNNNKKNLEKFIQLSLLTSIDNSGDLIRYYGSGIEYYRKLINDLEFNKPLFFQKKKLINYNIKLKEYNDELSKLYSKMENEINLIIKMQEIL